MKTITVFYCLLSATWTVEANIYAGGLEGRTVTFMCKHKLALKNDKYLCKDPCKEHNDILVTVKYGAVAQSGRITLTDLGDGGFNINISQLQLSDAGRYWCGVDRPGFDTFTEVILTVEKASHTGLTTVTSDVSPTWTQAEMINSTQQNSKMDIAVPTNVSTTSNSTEREAKTFRMGTVWYATIGAVSMLTILVFAAGLRKCREISKPQPHVCSNSRGPCSAHEREDNSGKKVRRSCAQQPRLDPPTSAAAAAENTSCPIYENIPISGLNTDSRPSAANDHNRTSRVYIKPLPTRVCE